MSPQIEEKGLDIALHGETVAEMPEDVSNPSNENNNDLKQAA